MKMVVASRRVPRFPGKFKEPARDGYFSGIQSPSRGAFRFSDCASVAASPSRDVLLELPRPAEGRFSSKTGDGRASCATTRSFESSTVKNRN